MIDAEFVGFPKIARLNRQIVVTEKIDGTNACIYITESGDFLTGSRSRLITPEDDNFGFSRWAYGNRDELTQLGPGYHFGEWWGAGIKRGYNQSRKRFSLFDVSRWAGRRPDCCDVVPVLSAGMFHEINIPQILEDLRLSGSMASPGFMRPEGIVIYHTAANIYFKRTLLEDEE